MRHINNPFIFTISFYIFQVAMVTSDSAWGDVIRQTGGTERHLLPRAPCDSQCEDQLQQDSHLPRRHSLQPE